MTLFPSIGSPLCNRSHTGCETRLATDCIAPEEEKFSSIALACAVFIKRIFALVIQVSLDALLFFQPGCNWDIELLDKASGNRMLFI